jgi:hypothetical protein
MNKYLVLSFFIGGAGLVVGQPNSSAPLLLSGGPNQRLIQVVDSTHQTTGFQVMGDGRIFARELEITIKDFPDYVFEPTYPLLSLDSLNSYIQQQGHLPDLPSTKEVAANSDIVNVSDLLKIQIKKIEELTLYILQLQAQIKELRGEK